MKGEFETALNVGRTPESSDAGNNQNSAGDAGDTRRQESRDNLAGLAGIDTPNVQTEVMGGKSQGNKEEERERDDLI